MSSTSCYPLVRNKILQHKVGLLFFFFLFSFRVWFGLECGSRLIFYYVVYRLFLRKLAELKVSEGSSSAPRMNQPKVKRRVGKYEVGRTIGEGTFAKVKFARNSETGEPVALKILDKEKVLKHKMAEQVSLRLFFFVSILIFCNCLLTFSFSAHTFLDLLQLLLVSLFYLFVNLRVYVLVYALRSSEK